MKIRPLGGGGGELFYADRRTDGRIVRQNKINSGFSQFCLRTSKLHRPQKILRLETAIFCVRNGKP
jgi:hypothetical protein